MQAGNKSGDMQRGKKPDKPGLRKEFYMRLYNREETGKPARAGAVLGQATIYV